VVANGRISSVTTAAVSGGGSSSGYLANAVIFASSAGVLSNTANLLFFQSNNTLDITGTIAIGNTQTAGYATMIYNATQNSIDFTFF
jgi:hypothetical protein